MRGSAAPVDLGLKSCANSGPQVRTEEDAGAADGGEGGEDGDDSKPRNGVPWDGTDRDYMYEELLGARPPRPAACSPPLAHHANQACMKPGRLRALSSAL